VITLERTIREKSDLKRGKEKNGYLIGTIPHQRRQELMLRNDQEEK